MNELLLIIGIFVWAAIVGTVASLMKDGYCGIIRFKNRRIRKHIDFLYCIGMVESANILQAPFRYYSNYWRRKL